MHVYLDYRGNRIRLTEDRLAHILEHPEMRGMEPRIAEVPATPERVVESLSGRPTEPPKPRLPRSAKVKSSTATQ